jgi:hypothetical protein
MAEDPGKEEEKFDFTGEGEAVGYISLAQARFVAMQTAQREPGNYGPTWQTVSMVFEVVDAEETEDDYALTLAFRPEGEFTGTSGREQFVFRNKLDEVTFRQVLTYPRTREKWPLPMVAAVGAGVIGLLAIIVVVLASVGGDDVPVSAQIAANTPVPIPAGNTVLVISATPTSVAQTLAINETSTPPPTDTPLPTQSSEPKSTAVPTAAPIAIQAAFAPSVTPSPSPTSTPQPTPVATTPPEIIQKLLSKPWLRGSDTEDRAFSVPVYKLVLNAEATKMYSDSGGQLYRSSDIGRTWQQSASPYTTDNEHERQSLIVGPGGPDTLFTHSNNGFQQTTDGGNTWNQIKMPEACCLAVAAVEGFFLGAQESEDRSIFRSSDQGQTWREVSGMRSGGFVSEFLPVPGHPSALYSWNTRNPKGAGGGIGLFFSEDGGFSWTPIPPPSNMLWSEGMQVGFTFDSADPPNIYRAIEGKFFKTNALHPGVWVVAPWAERVQGYLVIFHPTDPNVFAVVTKGDPLFATLDGGQTFIPLHEAGYRIGNTIYSGLPPGVRRTTARPTVITVGPSPTICIGSASGVWCHTMLVTSDQAPTAAPTQVLLPTATPIPTHSPFLTYVHPTGSWQIDYPREWEARVENLYYAAFGLPQSTGEYVSPSLTVSQFEGGAIYEYATLETWRRSRLIDQSVTRVVSSRKVVVGGHDAFEEVRELTETGEFYEIGLYLILGTDTYYVVGSQANWPEDEPLFRQILYSFCLLPEC